MTNPTCAWYPDRETWVSCSRCEQKICPDCMTEAPVGFHCPDCMAESRRTVRQIKVQSQPVTRAIIGICVAVFGLEFLTGTDLAMDFGLAPVAVFEFGEWHRVVTAMFLHAGVIHITFNMLILYQFGSMLENYFGSAKFAFVYFFAGLGGSTASLLLNDPFTLSVGASGAIFGLMGAYLVVSRQLRVERQSVWVLLGINLVIGFVIPGIDWRAHLGGLIAGAIAASVIHRLIPN